MGSGNNGSPILPVSGASASVQRPQRVNAVAMRCRMPIQSPAASNSGVTSQEPPQADDPLLAALSGENFILTPHVAWASDEAMQTLASQLSANIDAFFAGERLRRLD